MLRLLRWGCLLVLLQYPPAGAGQAPAGGAAAAPPADAAILATVNGKPVTEERVLRRLQAVDGALEPYRQDANRWRRLLEAGLEAEIRDQLLLQAAVAAGVGVTGQEVEAARAGSRRLLGEEGYRTLLAKRGATEQEYADFLRERLLIERYKAGLFKDIALDEATLRAYFDGHPERFSRPRRVQLEALPPKPAGAARQAPPRWFAVEALPSGLRAQLETARAGDVIEAVGEDGQSRRLRVLAVEEARPLRFDEAREGVRAVLLRRRQAAALEDWYTRARNTATIDYLPLP
jgi:hypothetical protein